MAIIGGRAHSLEELDEVAKTDFPYIEINVDDPAAVETQLDEFIERRERYNIYYLAHYPNEGNPTDVQNLQEVFVPKMKKLMDFSPALGIQKGTMHFWMDKRWAPDDLVKAKTDMLAELVEHAAKRDMVLCLENLTARHDTFGQIFEAVPGLMMTMDIGHGELLSDINTSFGFMEHLFDRIKHVHVHDNQGGTGVKDDLHLPLGEGIVDYPKILTQLKALGYDSTITMEVKPGDIERTMKEVRQYI